MSAQLQAHASKYLEDHLIMEPGQPLCSLSLAVAATGRRVTINSGSKKQVSKNGGGCVLITPLSKGTYSMPNVPTAKLNTTLQGASPLLSKVLVNVASKDGPISSGKMFTLRDLDITAILTCEDLKGEDLKDAIKRQLTDDIVDSDFDVGYVEGSSVVRIRNRRDLEEVWSCIAKSKGKVMLWCDGLSNTKESRKRPRSDGVSVVNKKKKVPDKADKEQKVQQLVDSLKEKHLSDYTPMQFRIWAEMVASGMYCSMDNPPNTTMFTRAGSGTPSRKKDYVPVARALSDAATVIATALSPAVSTSSTRNSPAKVIESRSKLYKQLNELQNLKQSGVLTDEEYCEKKEGTIMKLLNN